MQLTVSASFQNRNKVSFAIPSPAALSHHGGGCRPLRGTHASARGWEEHLEGIGRGLEGLSAWEKAKENDRLKLHLEEILERGLAKATESQGRHRPLGAALLVLPQLQSCLRLLVSLISLLFFSERAAGRPNGKNYLRGKN